MDSIIKLSAEAVFLCYTHEHEWCRKNGVGHEIHEGHDPFQALDDRIVNEWPVPIDPIIIIFGCPKYSVYEI